MAISLIPKHRRDGTLLLGDLGASHTLTVQYEEGNLEVDIPGEGIDLYLDRGQITSPPLLRYSDDQPMTFTFTAILRDLSDASYITLESLILRSGYAASTWVSTMGATGEVFTVNLGWTIAGVVHGDSAAHTLTLPYCAIRGSLSEGSPNIIKITGTSYAVYPTVT